MFSRDAQAIRTVAVIIVVLILSILGFFACRLLTTPLVTAQDPVPSPTIPLIISTPFPTATFPPLPQPTVQPPPANPPPNAGLPPENSEWFIDGWVEDGLVVNVRGLEVRSDLAQFRNSQTNAAIVVQCIDPQAARPNLDFTRPLEQRDRFIYRGNIFWHTTNPAVQRFIFVRHGEL